MSGKYQKFAVSGALSTALAALGALAAVAADGTALPIKSIAVDNERQIVVQFASRAGVFPTVPHLLDLPGPNHRVVLDFAGAAIEKGTITSPEDLTTAMSRNLPAIKGVRYSNVANAAKPTARVVVDLPEAVHADPRVVKLDETSITISLGEGVSTANAEAAAPTTAPTTAAAADDATDGAAAGAPVPTAINKQVDTTFTPAGGGTAAASAPAAPAAGGSAWDWGGQNPNAATDDAAAPKAAAAPAATAEDKVDGDAVASAGTPVPAQPVNTAELKPAINAPADQSAAPAPGAADQTAEQPLTSAAPAAVTGAAVPGSTPADDSAAQAAKAQTALKLYNSAVRNHLSGKLDQAIADYKGALAVNPSLAEAHSNLGLIYNQQHNYSQALAEFRKALAINPRDAITYNGIGAALRAERDLLGAIKNWQTAISLDPHLATAHYNLGTAFEIQKDYDRALEAYKQAVKNDYRLGEAYYRMGLISYRNHKLDEAANEFRDALKVSASSEYSEDARQRLAMMSKGTDAKH